MVHLIVIYYNQIYGISAIPTFILPAPFPIKCGVPQGYFPLLKLLPTSIATYANYSTPHLARPPPNPTPDKLQHSGK